eukprot:2002024-Pleurochrysis_carterae.AAC.7
MRARVRAEAYAYRVCMVVSMFDWLHANKGQQLNGKCRQVRIIFSPYCQVVANLPEKTPATWSCPGITCRGIWHSQRSAEVTVIARGASQAIFNCHESLPARAATSLQMRNEFVHTDIAQKNGDLFGH